MLASGGVNFYKLKILCLPYYLLTYLVGLSRLTTRPRHNFRSAIIEASSVVFSAPVSRLRVSIYDALGHPLPRWPCLGSHSTRG